MEIFGKLWSQRKVYLKVLPAVLVGTYLLMVCIPRYYRCTVSLAPETSNASSMSGSLGTLASSFGLGNLAKMASDDALYAEIYPDIIASNNFIAGLMTIPVETQDGEVKTNYYTYLKSHQKAAWWNHVKSYIGELLSPTPKDGYSGKEKISVFNLTKSQQDIFQSVQGKITCKVDKKTEVVSINVVDQDPLVCATMADETCKKLQEFIVNYRTNKAHIDYEYYKKLATDSYSDYVKARQAYARFADSNQDLLLASYKAKEEDLENEMQLKYNVYTAMCTQMQAAQAKLQEATPAFTMIQSATIPVKPAGPKRVIIALAMTILAFMALSAWLLMGKKLKLLN